MGASIERFANRIAGGEFSLDGKTYEIPKNPNAGNTLHGGTMGFDRKVWLAKPVADGVVMTLVSPDGDMGFPWQSHHHGHLYAATEGRCSHPFHRVYSEDRSMRRSSTLRTTPTSTSPK